MCKLHLIWGKHKRKKRWSSLWLCWFHMINIGGCAKWGGELGECYFSCAAIVSSVLTNYCCSAWETAFLKCESTRMIHKKSAALRSPLLDVGYIGGHFNPWLRCRMESLSYLGTCYLRYKWPRAMVTEPSLCGQEGKQSYSELPSTGSSISNHFMLCSVIPLTAEFTFPPGHLNNEENPEGPRRSNCLICPIACLLSPTWKSMGRVQSRQEKHKCECFSRNVLRKSPAVRKDHSALVSTAH